MKLWRRFLEWRREGKAERKAIRESERSQLRAGGDEPEREVDPLQQNTILGPRP
jgi:hypothetical protein